MFSGAFSTAYFILAIVFFVYLSQFLAKKKGLDPVFWAVMGGLVGPLAIPFILLAESKNKFQ